MNFSQNGVDFIKQFEGCRLTSYQDSVGVWTIGFGHTGNVKAGQKITQAEAEALLRKDAKRFIDAVNKLITVPLTQNQFDALVSFSYNLGEGALQKSTLRKKLNAKDYKGAADEFLKWDKAGGQTLKGLTRRRKAERALFLTKAPAPKPTPKPVVKPAPKPVVKPAVKPVVKPKALGKVTVITGAVNIRKSASLEATAIGTLTKGTTMSVLEKKNGFYRIGEGRWITASNKYVKFK